MNITDELERLSKLHRDGALTDDEFATAKARLLASESPSEVSDASQPEPRQESGDNSLGEAANRYVTFQIIMGVIGLIIFLIFFFTVFVPHMPGNGPLGH